MAEIVRTHRFRVSWMQRRAVPRGERLVDLFENHQVLCCAVTHRQALRRAGVPPNPIGLIIVREGA